MQKILITLNDQGGAVMSWNYDELSPSLRNQMKHHEPIVVVEEDDNISDSRSVRSGHNISR